MEREGDRQRQILKTAETDRQSDRYTWTPTPKKSLKRQISAMVNTQKC